MISGSSIFDKIESESKIRECKTVYKKVNEPDLVVIAMVSTMDEAKSGSWFLLVPLINLLIAFLF